MTQTDSLQSSAKQGNPEAIAALINHSLQPTGITAKALVKEGCLHVLFSSPRTLKKQAVIEFARRNLERLGVQSFEAVTVYGKTTGENLPTWSETFVISPVEGIAQPQNSATVTVSPDNLPSSSTSPTAESDEQSSDQSVAPNASLHYSQTTAEEDLSRTPPPRVRSLFLPASVLIPLAFLLGLTVGVAVSHANRASSLAHLGVVFLTGLTAGGLSCLAVQGGLLASSIAHQAEQDIHRIATNPQQASAETRELPPSSKHHLALPILLFLGAKLVAYTLLGVLLGWLGSMLQLTPWMRGILQIAIGIFMVGTALQMLNVHPIFRLFALEPPAFLTRYIRRTAKRNTTTITPLFLGAMTVLIPCGVTQAMMALAIGTGSPLEGAAIMSAFTLGTTPVFFTLAYLVTSLGKRLERRFLQIVAVVVLLLGLVSLDGGLNLIGSPFSFANLRRNLKTAMQAPSQQKSADSSSIPSVSVNPSVAPASDPVVPPVSVAPATPSNDPGQIAPDASSPTLSTDNSQAAPSNTVTINVKQDGYTPDVLYAKAGQPVKLVLVTNNTHSCARAFVIPSLNIQQVLPETGETAIDLPAQSAGTVQFTCSMGMFQGNIQFQ